MRSCPSCPLLGDSSDVHSLRTSRAIGSSCCRANSKTKCRQPSIKVRRDGRDNGGRIASGTRCDTGAQAGLLLTQICPTRLTQSAS